MQSLSERWSVSLFCIASYSIDLSYGPDLRSWKRDVGCELRPGSGSEFNVIGWCETFWLVRALRILYL